MASDGPGACTCSVGRATKYLSLSKHPYYSVVLLVIFTSPHADMRLVGRTG